MRAVSSTRPFPSQLWIASVIGLRTASRTMTFVLNPLSYFNGSPE
jgi:hypothetical protein